jgi:hypothetical protein
MYFRHNLRDGSGREMVSSWALTRDDHAEDLARTGIESEEKADAIGFALRSIEAVTPWTRMERKILPFYPSSGGRGRQSIDLMRTLWAQFPSNASDSPTKALKTSSMMPGRPRLPPRQVRIVGTGRKPNQM